MLLTQNTECIPYVQRQRNSNSNEIDIGYIVLDSLPSYLNILQ